MVRTKAPPFFISIQQMTVVDRQAQISCSVVFVQMGFICCDTESRNEYNSAETGFYYLSSRYYNPETCRFISPDDVTVLEIDQDSIIENNLFVYCLNNPANKYDPNGYLALALAGGGYLAGSWAFGGANFWNPVGWIILGTATVVTVGVGVYYAAEHTKNKRKSTSDKHTKPRPGRQSEKKKQKTNWKKR